MINHFNYTGRREIKARHARLSIDADRGLTAIFDLDELKFPPAARLYVEALAGGSSQLLRFEFGVVSAPTPPGDTSLNGLVGDSIFFRVKVVDEQNDVGRLLGLCSQLRPREATEPVDEDAGRLPILPVNATDLGERVWKLTFANDRPWLEVNDRIAGIKTLARNDEQFFGLVYPEVVRGVLARIFTHEGYFSIENDNANWRDQWLRFGLFWHPERAAPPVPADVDDVSDDERNELENWIEQVVDGFCERKNVRINYEAAANDEENA